MRGDTSSAKNKGLHRLSESTSDGKKSANKERAATVIQSAWRRYKKRAIQKLEKAASIIQAAWRAYQVTKMRKVVMENAAAIIQTA
ncbi:abnormal spindle-like microcephaly-associated protein homolog [Acropora muricata]|uniref:abnormal spindle-like microcephaly-associated protein homolog n=1 Tax=Acropora muricata TaxID=159855 RepID=UPI0034E40E6F